MSERPQEIPTYGWTEDGKVVRLFGKTIAQPSPIKMVTGDGWDAWYYVMPGEYKVKESKRPKKLRSPLDFFGCEPEG